MIPNITYLQKKAAEIRYELLRTFSFGKAHHFGGSFSCVELATALFFYKMNYSLRNREAPDRDRFIMSKGHSVPVQYVILAMLGIHSPEELKTIKTPGSVFQGHPDMRKTRGIEAPTGSLGQGLSFANGMAIAGRDDGLEFNVFLILGDGELQEGQVWEAAMTTAHYKLNNVCVIVDQNRYQSQGASDDLMRIEPLEEKFSSFGWKAVRVDGHDFNSICKALDEVNGQNHEPVAIIADTIKGKGISFIENTYKYHNYKLSEDEYLRAEIELKTRLEETRGM